MNVDEVTEFIHEHFPQGVALGELLSLKHMGAVMRLDVDDCHLRPGGTVSGPAMMGLADIGMYAAILGAIGPAKMAVTSNLSINFFRRPEPNRAVIADVQLLKVGRRLAVGEVYLCSEGEDEPVAHAVCTYALPND